VQNEGALATVLLSVRLLAEAGAGMLALGSDFGRPLFSYVVIAGHTWVSHRL